MINKKLKKTVGFLDFMIRAVFISTFIFTVAMGYLAWYMHWEQVAVTLVERWFTIMVGELIVMGFIQIVKELSQSLTRMKEIEFEKELNKDNY